MAKGDRTELKGSRQFLCKKHYKEFRRDRERKRIKGKRKGYDFKKKEGKYYKLKTNREKEYNTKLGTSNFGSRLKRNENGDPDFDSEERIVKREKNRIYDGKTIGDHALKNNAGNPCTESRKELLDSDKLSLKKDENGFVQYNNNDTKVDEWYAPRKDDEYVEVDDVDKLFQEPEKQKKSLKKIYQNFEYYKKTECNAI